jgi:hypothetical protein
LAQISNLLHRGFATRRASDEAGAQEDFNGQTSATLRYLDCGSAAL